MLTYVITYHIGKHKTQILVPKSHGLAHALYNGYGAHKSMLVIAICNITHKEVLIRILIKC